MINTIKRTICERSLINKDAPAVLMVSGGSDSTALAYLMADLRQSGELGSLAVLHVNHMLRADAADADQAFVEELCRMLELPCFTCRIDVAQLAEATGGNVEAIGREQRYLAAHEALESLCRNTGTPVSEGRILTAHTQNDRVENFYMRSIKGTGPGGFRSMLYANGPIVRPLLDVSREALRDYLHQRAEAGEPVCRDAEGFLWREDATNAHLDRFRAYVRARVVPSCERHNPRLLDTLTRTMNLIADEDDFLDAQACEVFSQQVELIDEPGPDTTVIAARLAPEFGAEHVVIKRRVVRAVLQTFLGSEARIDAATIEAVLSSFDESGAPCGGYVANIQGDLAVSANKQGVLIEPMSRFRARRKRTE